MASVANRKPNTVCRVCDKTIYRRPFEIERGPVFCSSTCYGLHNKKTHRCPMCGIHILAGEKKKYCSRTCANKSRTGIAYKSGSPKDKVKNHRSLRDLIFQKRGPKCEDCGFDAHEILQIHHIDRDRKNNTLTNLRLLCPNCHALEHFRLRK